MFNAVLKVELGPVSQTRTERAFVFRTRKTMETLAEP